MIHALLCVVSCLLLGLLFNPITPRTAITAAILLFILLTDCYIWGFRKGVGYQSKKEP